MDVPAVTAIQAHTFNACTVRCSLPRKRGHALVRMANVLKYVLPSENEPHKPNPARLSLNVTVLPNHVMLATRGAPVRIRRLDLSSIERPCFSQSQQ